MGPLSRENLPEGSTAALDTVALVYLLERHPTHYDTAKGLLSRIEGGEIAGVLSCLVFTELLVPPYRSGDSQRAESVLRLLTNFPNLKVVDVTPEISAQAARLRARYGLRTPDAIHAATALNEGADVIVTNDRDLLKLGAEIRVLRFE
ncbi:MAG: type II toxin-antitoxin system VapC family toxin [Deltaproteobacteria bacterium]|nr:type II toxin-antitoxin system VapC family toxin [Deltaproteobacteria bacterium]